MKRAKRVAIAAMAVILCLPLAGCQQSRQIENIALAILMGIDMDAEGTIELTVQFPKIGAPSGEGKESAGSGEGQSQDSGYLLASAKGVNFSEALELLRLTIHHDLSLRQVKMLVVGENLASSEAFRDITRAISETFYLYNAATLVVCMGKAKEFVEEQKPLIGTRISTGLVAMLEQYQKRGYIPAVSFADYYYSSISVYSDPLAVLAAKSKPDAEMLPEDHIGDNLPDQIPVQSDNLNEYMGSAVFQNGVMVGKLNGLETLYVTLFDGGNSTINYTLEDKVVQLNVNAAPKISVNVSKEPIKISIKVDLTVAALTIMPNIEEIRDRFEQDMLATLRHCQELKIEPFGFAEIAAKNFMTMDQWLEFDWHEKFSRAEFDLDIRLHKSDT